MARETRTISRREMLKRSAALAALASAQLAWPSWMPRLAFAANRAPKGDILVCVFLRGGADGLNVIIPHGDEFYYQARPTLALARPDDTKADKKGKVLDLDGFFGLHPNMDSLLPIFKGGQMVAVHAAGSPDPTRSHFDAMDFMERGAPGDHSIATGWLARHLNVIDYGTAAPLRAVGWGTALQASLRGTVNATALQSIANYHLMGRADVATEMLKTLNALYTADSNALKAAANQTNAALEIVSKVNIATYTPASGAKYDQSDFHMALMQTAALIKADLGLEVAAIDLGGWDTHQNELQDIGNDLAELASGLAAFHADMGDQMKNITVVVMSEFGRRVQENASGGTDHGHGNMMMVMGGHVSAKPVITDWPTLAPEKLYNGDDLAITTDYRDVLSEILSLRLNNTALNEVFPNYTPKPRGVLTK